MFNRIIKKLKLYKKRKAINYPNVNWEGTSFVNCDVEVSASSNVKVNSKVYFRKGCAVRVRENACLKIGDNVSFNNNCILTCREKIVIGNNVLIGPNTLIFDHDHDYKSDDFMNKFKTKPIIIEDNVWIGGNCTILKGSHIHSGAVIGANTIVNKEISENTVYVNSNDEKLIPYSREKSDF